MKSYEKGKLPYIVFGSKKASQLGKYLKDYSFEKCLIISDSVMIKHAVTKRALNELESLRIKYDIYDKVIPEPSDEICIKIAGKIKNECYDCIIGIGGGSPMDVAKAASLIAGIPDKINDLHEYGKSGHLMKEKWTRPCMLILMPTTAGTGAETTGSAVLSSTKHNLKFSFGNRNITADLCIIDPEFTVGMPLRPTVFGGADAISHIIENLIGTGANEYTNTILLECLKHIWQWLPVAIKEPENLEAREQVSWAAHNSLANGGIPNGHAVAHAMGSLYHLVHGHAAIITLPTVIRHFAEASQESIKNIAQAIDVPVTGNAIKDADNVANAIIVYYKNLGLKPFSEAMADNDFNDDEKTFANKMIPVILDDFKSKEWMPPIHTGNYTEKIRKICNMIYEEH